MPYTIDPELNRENAYSPSPLSIENQFVYRFGALEAMIKSSLKSIEDKIDDVRQDLATARTDTKDLTKRVEAIETWQSAAKIRMGMVIAGATAVWVLLGDTVHNWIGRVFG